MPETHITIGVAGHVDHGKTSLVKRLTGIDTDRLKEEKRRGLTIEPGIALLELPSGKSVALVDVPGHSDFLKHTIRGLSAVDMALLVVAADDGVMPQTLDHLEILRILGAQQGLVVISKADLVDEETLELAELEIREIVQGTAFADQPVIPFSSLTGRGLSEIRSALENGLTKVKARSLKAPFRLWIDQVRSFPGFGTVVSGTIGSGVIHRDDPLVLYPNAKETKARFLEVHHRRVDQAVAGQRVGINLHKINTQEVKPGMVLARPGWLQPIRFLNAELSLSGRTKLPLTDHQRVKLHVGTGLNQARVVLMTRSTLQPGETGLVQFRLDEPLAAAPRDSFVISPMNYNTVIGGGIIIEPSLEKFRAGKAEKTLTFLRPLRRQDLKTVTGLYFLRHPLRPVKAEEIAQFTGFPEEPVRKELLARVKSGELLNLNQQGFFPRARYESLKKELPGIMQEIFRQDAFKLTVAADEIRCRLHPGLHEAPFERLLAALLKEGKVLKTDLGYGLPGHQVSLPVEQEKLAEKLLHHAQRLGFASFSAGFFCRLHGRVYEKREIQKLLDHLQRRKLLVRLNDNRFLTFEAMEVIKDKVAHIIRTRERFTLQDAKEVLGYGRTHAIPVLEYLDTIGFTRRIGDERFLVEKVPAKTNTPPVETIPAPGEESGKRAVNPEIQ